MYLMDILSNCALLGLFFLSAVPDHDRIHDLPAVQASPCIEQIQHVLEPLVNHRAVASRTSDLPYSSGHPFPLSLVTSTFSMPVGEIRFPCWAKEGEKERRMGKLFDKIPESGFQGG